MENEPDMTNLVFIDEYPELAKKVWLRRLAQSRKMGQVISMQNLIIFPTERREQSE